ncbi:hypothetical protein N9D63_05645 [Opitutales bacterium]|nr:hypothetical protein [Opitutales bacterium]
MRSQELFPLESWAHPPINSASDSPRRIARVPLTQSGYWKPATNTFRKFLVDESGDAFGEHLHH